VNTSFDPARVDWVAIFDAADLRVAQEFGLVLDARGIPYELTHERPRWRVNVPPEWAAAAARELMSYAAENAKPRGGEVELEDFGAGWVGAAGYALVIVVVSILATRQIGAVDWYTLGRADALAIKGGEWWRAVTALTLHADYEHLLGNAVFGCFFGYFVGRHVGDGRAWALILGAGACGNLLNAAVHTTGHLSVGASTAVFAALGLLAALAWHHGYLRYTPWRKRFAPIFAGIALLAYTGTAGENTDLGAHLFGFLSGLGCGLVWRRRPAKTTRFAQFAYASGALAVLTVCWALALGVVG
jgi:membrane associated rhomboid family serine protease